MKSILEKISQLRVLVIGDTMLDAYLQGSVRRISPEAPVPIVNVEQENYRVGAAANVAFNIADLGAHAQLCGVIGQDKYGDKIKAYLEDKGIVLHVDKGQGTPRTIVKTRVIAHNQQLCRIDYEDDPEAYQLNLLNDRPGLEQMIAGVDAVIFSDYAKGVLSEALIVAVQEVAQSKGTFIAMDPKPKSSMHYEGLDLMTPNREESYQLAGIQPQPHKAFPAAEICARIYERYRPKTLIITLGGEGMLVSCKGEILKRIPTYAREIFDVSGAGDTVVAALTLSLLAGAEVETAAKIANTAAGVVLTKLGAATATPEEVLGYHKQH